MTAKGFAIVEAARHKIAAGADTLAGAVRLTLGPRGRAVLLQREYDAPAAVNPGVVVAVSVEPADSFGNMGARTVREVTMRSGAMAGDGTTTGILPAQAMVREGARIASLPA